MTDRKVNVVETEGISQSYGATIMGEKYHFKKIKTELICDKCAHRADCAIRFFITVASDWYDELNSDKKKLVDRVKDGNCSFFEVEK